MIIRFVVKNYLSFNEETEFNMLAGKVRRHPQHITPYKSIRLLKSSIIYGANGSGKSNLIHAISLLEDIVTVGELVGFSDSNKFKLNPENEKLPITFEIEFVIGKNAFAYGISFNENHIIEEWLYKLEFGKKDDSLIFERKTSSRGKSKVTLAPKYLKSEKNKILIEVYEDDLLEKDVPFLYLARNQKFKELSKAWHWFDNNIKIIYPNARFRGFAGFMNRDGDFRNFTNQVIADLDTGIKKLKIKKIDFNKYFGEDNITERDDVLRRVMDGDEVVMGNYYANAVAYLENDKPVVKKIYSIHEDVNGEEIEFELVEESEGSLRLLDFLPAFHWALKKPVTILIDEIDQSIHVNLLRELVSRLQAKGELQGQIIFTTHESNLLDLNLFRQDEIWFTEKDKVGASHLYPLSDFDIRTEMDIEKGYLSGRFGAIPFLGNLKDLNWVGNGQEE